MSFIYNESRQINLRLLAQCIEFYPTSRLPLEQLDFSAVFVQSHVTGAKL